MRFLIYAAICFVSWYLVIDGDAHGERGVWAMSGLLFNTVLAFPWSLVYVLATIKDVHISFQLLIFVLVAGQLASFLILFGVGNIKFISRKFLRWLSRSPR